MVSKIFGVLMVFFVPEVSSAMATISRIPFYLSISSSQFRKPLLQLDHQQLLSTSDRNLRNNHGFICFACSIKRTRVRKKVKSVEELRSEIMDFLALVGLPEGHVPSMKELSNHGRHDLANIVRRRGYKFIRQLVADSKIEDHKQLVQKQPVDVEQSAGSACGQDSLAEGQDERTQGLGEEELPSSGFSSMIRCSTVLDGSISRDWEDNDSIRGNIIPILTPDFKEQGSAGEDESSPPGISSAQDFSAGLGDLMHPNLSDNSHSGGIAKDDLMTKSPEVDYSVNNEMSSSAACISGEVSLVLEEVPSCLDKDDDKFFVTNDKGVIDVDKDTSSSTYASTFEHYTTPDFNSSDHAREKDGRTQMFGDSSVTSSIEEKVTRFIQNGYLDPIEDNENSLSNGSDQQETKEHSETHPTKAHLMTDDHDYVDDNHGSQGNASMASNGSALALEEVSRAAVANSSDRDDLQRDSKDDLDKDLHNENTRREIHGEISHLKILLHQKELELSRLKEQVEKEKLALSFLQRKAETEIDKAQKLIQEKDAELHAVEGSLSGLKEFEIEYGGDGDIVEVTGSFNGWQHRLEMELQSTNGIGNQRRWSTILWLYPGTYEIKFIVDGQWKIDPQRESVTRAHITNNILKVDR